MLERPAHQAAGLLTLARSHAPKLMAMVSHGDEQSELPLLWRLCSSLVDFGYAVTVLDATTRESENNPGLEQLLEYTYWPGETHHETPEWTVMPAAMGLQSLCAMPERRAQSLQLIGRLFPHEGAVVLYGKTDLLVPLLAQSGIKPLLAVAPAKSSLITSYRALKHLLLRGRLEPTIVNLVHKHSTTAAAGIGSVAASLSDCARNFLGYEVNALNIAAMGEDDKPSADLQHLALRMVEGAIPLQVDFAPGSSPRSFGNNHSTFARGH
jgi:hypothetical protein